jgi:hypothetical protein
MKKKSKRDLEMKHKTAALQSHSNISLQRFEMGETQKLQLFNLTLTPVELPLGPVQPVLTSEVWGKNLG